MLKRYLNNKRRILCSSLVTLPMLALVACTNSEKYEDLAVTYLTKVKNQDWDSLYSCKSSAFKDLVPYDVFVRSMKKNADQYEISTFVISDVRKVDNFIGVKFDYIIIPKETGNNQFFPAGVSLSANDEQIWEIGKDNSLVCRDLGMSMFFTLNSDKFVKK